MDIVAGLPDGPERERWRAEVVLLARRLRAYEKFVPIWHRVIPFGMAIGWGVLITIFIVDPAARAVATEEPPAIVLGVAGLVGTVGYLWVAIAGGDLHGRDPDYLLAQEEAQADATPDDQLDR